MQHSTDSTAATPPVLTATIAGPTGSERHGRHPQRAARRRHQPLPPLWHRPDIQLRPSAGMLVCLFCRHEWAEARLDESVTTSGNLASLTGTIIGSGAADISADANAVITLKCGGCGAEVIVNTAEQMGARCHWCRHVLTVNEQIPNGAVPDAVLPFTVTHDQAVAKIAEFHGEAPDVRRSDLRAGVHAGERRRGLHAVPGRRRQRQRRRRRFRRDQGHRSLSPGARATAERSTTPTSTRSTATSTSRPTTSRSRRRRSGRT